MIEIIRKIRINRLKAKALKGNKKAQYRLACIYNPDSHTTGIDDYKECVKWTTMLSEAGHAEADYLLACFFNTDGKGVKKDKDRAMFYLIRSANRGFDRAKIDLTRVQKKSNAKKVGR